MSRLAACILALLPAAARADTGGLVANSPFQPPQAAAQAAAPAQQDDYEFGGVTVFAGRPLLSIENKAAQRGYWLGLGESRDGITVLDYDAARRVATVEAGGRRRELPLRIAAQAIPTVAQAQGAVAQPGANRTIPGRPITARPATLPAPQMAQPNAAGPASPVPQPPRPNTTVAQAQPGATRQQAEAENARAFVQDLLEMQQRHRQRAEEARRLPEGQQPLPPTQ